MAKKLYVGNLSYDMSQDDLRTIFEEFGTVDSAQVIMDRESGRSKGFGFVEMSNEDEAQAAISALNGEAGVWTHLDRERSPSLVRTVAGGGGGRGGAAVAAAMGAVEEEVAGGYGGGGGYGDGGGGRRY